MENCTMHTLSLFGIRKRQNSNVWDEVNEWIRRGAQSAESKKVK